MRLHAWQSSRPTSEPRTESVVMTKSLNSQPPLEPCAEHQSASLLPVAMLGWSIVLVTVRATGPGGGVWSMTEKSARPPSAFSKKTRMRSS